MNSILNLLDKQENLHMVYYKKVDGILYFQENIFIMHCYMRKVGLIAVFIV